MSDIKISDVTNSTDNEAGTGVFDVLMQSVARLMTGEYDAGRIIGTEYSVVFLGALQEVLKTATAFVLQEQEAGLKADLLTLQIVQEEEKTDLIIGQTAETYEKVDASRADTARRNLLNNKEAINLGHKAALIQSQTLGFENDTKQKLLKQFLEGYSVNLSITGTANVPESTKDAAIDQLSQEILDSMNSGVIIQSIAQTPDDGSSDGAPT